MNFESLIRLDEMKTLRLNKLMTVLLLLVFVCTNSISFAEETVLDLDADIKDIKLRAQSGAKSKWSSSLFMNYAGASFSKPFDDERPNPEGFAWPEPVSVAGSIGLRRRLNKNDSIYLASGFYKEKPLHGDEQTNKLDISTPQVSFNKTGLIQNTETSQSIQVFVTTQDYMREIGDVGSIGYSISGLQYFLDTKWSAGLSVLTRFTFFDLHEKTIEPFQSDYGLSLSPFLQFNVTSKLQVFTSISLLGLNHFRNESSAFDMKSLPISQNLGLGWSILRDLYFAPNINFSPERISRKSTSVNASLTVNL